MLIYNEFLDYVTLRQGVGFKIDVEMPYTEQVAMTARPIFKHEAV